MARKHLQSFRGVDNADIINAIRKNSTSLFQSRVPLATQARLQDTADSLMDYQPIRNEFIDALVNQIGRIEARTMTWKNPLAKFKLGMMTSGDTMEEYMTGLARSYTYDAKRDALEKTIFGQEPLEAQSSFHRINREEFYKVTVNRNILKRALIEPDGLGKFVGQIMASAVNADQVDEFEIMCSLFSLYYENEGFFKIQIPDVGAAASTMADAKVALRRMHEAIASIQFVSRMYNAAGMPTFASPDDLEIFMTPEYKAAIDVEALASLFNLSAAEVPGRITVLPKEKFNIPGVQAIITTKDFFVTMDTLIENTNVDNPAGLYHNYFFHHHGIYSFSRFVPAILLTTEAGTPINVTPTPVTSVSEITAAEQPGGTIVTSLERGKFYQISSEAITTPAGGTNTAVRLDVVGEAGGVSDFTSLNQLGTLFVSHDEPSSELTFTSTSVDDETKFVTKTFDVTGDILQLWPDPQVIPEPAAP